MKKEDIKVPVAEILIHLIQHTNLVSLSLTANNFTSALGLLLVSEENKVTKCQERNILISVFHKKTFFLSQFVSLH